VEVIFFLIIIAVIVIAVAASQKQSAELKEAYSTLARHYGGQCEPGGMFTRPSAFFAHAGSPVVVDIYSTGGKHPTYYTQARFEWRQPGFRCEVYPEGIWSRVGKLMGMEDIEIGSPDFDRTYIITGSSPEELRKVLDPAVQRQIERLRRFLGNNNIYISFGQGTLLVKKLSLIRNPGQLLRFVGMAIDLYDATAGTMAEGIEFVEQTRPPKASEVMCQICGEAVTSEAVFCRKCKTPHHLDCWEYYGACSTYGCQETRYLLPRRKRAASSRRGKSKSLSEDGTS
jgi:hypothetical protein